MIDASSRSHLAGGRALGAPGHTGRAGARYWSRRALLTDQQNKHSDGYQQGEQSTDGKRQNPVPTVQRLRSSALLRRSNAKPEEKVAHRVSRRAISSPFSNQGPVWRPSSAMTEGLSL
jgi:hypothetical protein